MVKKITAPVHADGDGNRHAVVRKCAAVCANGGRTMGKNLPN